MTKPCVLVEVRLTRDSALAWWVTAIPHGGIDIAKTHGPFDTLWEAAQHASTLVPKPWERAR